MNARPAAGGAPTSEGIGFVDSTLCAAQIALWNGTASDDMLLPIVDRMDQAGFAAIDILDGELCERMGASGADPLRRLRIAASRAKTTPLNIWLSALSGLGHRVLSAELIDRSITALVKAGARRITCYDALNDAAAIAAAIQIVRREGSQACAALVHAVSPLYDELHFAQRARDLAQAGARAICLVDLTGCLTPKDTFRLIAAIRNAVAGTITVEFRSACRSGVAEMCYFEAARAGARLLHTCTDSLSGGVSLPSSLYFAEHAQRFDMKIDVRADVLRDIDDYFGALAEADGLSLGTHTLPDAAAMRYQVPANLVTEIAARAAKAGVSAEDVLLESLSVRRHLGEPTMARPVGALVLRQALLNVVSGAAFKSLTAEARDYLDGRYGKAPGPLVESAGTQVKETEASGPKDLSPKNSGVISEEDFLLSAWLGHDALSKIHQGRSAPEPVRAASPLQLLKQRLDRLQNLRSVTIRKGDFLFESGAGDGKP